jgi:hypothetical protein
MPRESAEIAMLRHALAALAYRSAKVLRGAPGGFEKVRAAPTTRTAGEVLAHMGDLLEWAVAAADGDSQRRPPRQSARSWDREIARFFSATKALDDRLAAGAPLSFPPEKFLQGPLADALTHVGQLSTLRRIAGSAVRGENYFAANIVRGRVGMEQEPPAREFD